MSDCKITSVIDREKNSDHGFMGATHAMSAVAVFFAIAAFLPGYFKETLGVVSIYLIILTAINVVGACLSVDLDNTRSTAESTLGILGEALSLVYRTSSSIIQTTIRTKRDDSSPNPHRGFYHTGLSCILLGLLAYFSSQTNFFQVSLPGIGTVSSGFVIALVITWLNLQMALMGLAKKGMKSIQNSGGIFGELITFAISLAITYGLFTQVPLNTDFKWFAIAIGAGCFIHCLGDCFTKYGCPLLFPIPIKGKTWWYIRFMKITAGGTTEKYVFMPVFGIVIVLSAFRLLGLF